MGESQSVHDLPDFTGPGIDIAHHVSIEKGDILHIGTESYLVKGSVALGMPTREITFHLQHLSWNQYGATENNEKD